MKIIHISIILMYEVLGRDWLIPKKLKRSHPAKVKVKKVKV